jgi:hypothetical protein
MEVLSQVHWIFWRYVFFFDRVNAYSRLNISGVWPSVLDADSEVRGNEGNQFFIYCHQNFFL